MISKISKLLTTALLLAVNFNISYGMEDVNEANDENDHIFRSVIYMGKVTFPSILHNIQNNKQKLTNYNKELNEYNDKLKENIEKLEYLSGNNDDEKSIFSYSLDMNSELILNKDNKHKNIEHIIRKVSEKLEQLKMCNNNINNNNNEILNIKKNISNTEAEINKQIEKFYHYLTANDYDNITTMMHSEKDNIFEAINELLEIEEVKNYITNYNISKIDTIYTTAKDQFNEGLYGYFADNEQEKFKEIYNDYIEQGFKQYYDDIKLFNNKIDVAKNSIGNNEIKRNMLNTITQCLNEKKQYIDERKEKALAEVENIFNQIKKYNKNNIEDEEEDINGNGINEINNNNNINEENEINENVIHEENNNINNENDNNINNDNNNQSIINNNINNDIDHEEENDINENNIDNENDNDNNINEENEINEHVNEINENNINEEHDNNINNQNNINVNDELLADTFKVLLEDGHSEERQYEQFKEFCDYFFANNGDNIRNILINSNDDQLDYLLTILNINNELQGKFIKQYIDQHDLDIGQVMNNVYDIQSDNGKVNIIKNYISNIQFIQN